MAFASVPSESKNQINKAGAILASGNASPVEHEWALDLAERWRACHAYPINTFQATLRTKLGLYEPDSLAAQRLKRMPTIIDKLKRYPAMKLTTMQDIAGVRAILSSVEDVYKLVQEYQDSKRFAHELINRKDYIEEPRSEDGYRSVHLVYSYRNRRDPTYDGLRIELQIRTRLQHVWATAVESMSTFLGQALKSRQGDQDWLDFFALVSSAFAQKEKTTPVPRFASLSPEEISLAVAEAEARLSALDMMSGLSVAANAIRRTRSAGKAWFYHLIILKSLERTVEIKAYDRESFEKALHDYGRTEEQAARGAKIEPVLVSAGPVDRLRRAYPNFFLDINDFAKLVMLIVAGAREP
jgi:hypothetical protein